MFKIETRVNDLTGGTMNVSVSAKDGSYIGTPTYAHRLAELGIEAEAIPGHTVASIGFSAKEQKWFGWSHRAMCGFGVGSKVKFGDCAYVPKDFDDLRRCAVTFWSDEHHDETTAEIDFDDEGKLCAKVTWTYSADVPNENIRGKIDGATMYPPERWGRGEWTAETLDDAKQMAIDFAESVA